MWKGNKMKKIKITDEALLSYLIGDCDSEVSLEIELRLKTDSVLRQRLEDMDFIRGEVKNTPVRYKLKKKELNRKLSSSQLVLASMLIVIGVYTGTNLEFAPKESEQSSNISKSVSEPLNWDDSKFLSLM
jgi:hypothetical protein